MYHVMKLVFLRCGDVFDERRVGTASYEKVKCGPKSHISLVHSYMRAATEGL